MNDKVTNTSEQNAIMLAKIGTTIEYIQRDIGEIKANLKDSSSIYATKRELEDTNKKVNGLLKNITTVILGTVVSIITAFIGIIVSLITRK